MYRKYSFILLTLGLLTPILMADTPKEAIKTNNQLVYEKQKSVNSVGKMFSNGEFFGRLRSNTFSYTWEKETATYKDYLISGLGGSLVYKSARFNAVSFGVGLYYSHAFFNDSKYPVNTLTKGKDLLSRFDFVNTGSKDMAVLGQAYIDYTGIKHTKITLGRQLVETFYTKSNDTKMIPNTFDGVVLENASLPSTKIKLAYLVKQKLRDHTAAHSVLMYGDANSTSSLRPEWSENDDSAMHKGLTYTALKAAGVSTDAPLITGDLHNTSIKNLKTDLSFYYVPELLSELMAEANYNIAFAGFTLTPGLRYIKQIDDKAGSIGGAAYNASAASLAGYKNPNSLDSQMLAARIVLKIKNYKVNIGYSKVFDEADLITPWRGFPTSGYTRSMARYNWQANTKSYRIELVRNANKTGIYKNTFIQASVLHTDADEKKGYFDENYYYIGFVQNPLQNLQWRLRLGYQDTKKVDGDGLDSRLELNYLF
ncbi:hypothetical protein [Sulfurimonas autotrophica]|uniref:Outer membrane porin, OprD family n=1 Tax=Sulfurimonas autotrophica (strain ATCC BAA-671 / DSM 16294 / JCM 11897 / OK10) TaxID=563040 RepID=E0UR36_SULAO|nr:hypothetical protein [Sulfurimonas autotrophica]ADN09992.1 conserved hypothetical protein [Sulfurimonas autotrophica DSM 16294]